MEAFVCTSWRWPTVKQQHERTGDERIDTWLRVCVLRPLSRINVVRCSGVYHGLPDLLPGLWLRCCLNTHFRESVYNKMKIRYAVERYSMPYTSFASIDGLQAALAEHAYIADRALTTAIFLALKLNKPLLLEGEAGVGKTEIAKTLARMQGRELIRLQCYEGLDVNTTIYEWNYARQMLQIRLLEAQGAAQNTAAQQSIFGPEFLIKRPLLQAIEARGDQPPILLIDELDRADEEFEAFLLELLSDWQISIPEIGTIRAETPPTVIITSNRTREVHDALKRRCLFYWVDYPTLDKEIQIVKARVPGASERLARQVVLVVQELRRMDLYKLPGVAETLDWVTALVALDQTELTPQAVEDTLGAILKYQDDIAQVRGQRLNELLKRASVGVS